jgi:hypothetical protein
MNRKLTILTTLILLAAASFACTNPFNIRKVTGSGNIVTEQIEVSDFNEILLTGVGKLIVTQADEESLTITTDDNLIQYIETDVNNGVLELGFTNDVSFERDWGRKILDPSDSFIFNLSVIDLSSINLSGAATIDVQELTGENIRIVLSGAGDIKIDSLVADYLDVNISGAGNIEIAGKVEIQMIDLNGLGKYDAADLESQVTTITINGAGGAEVWAQKALNVTINGAGDVDYFGDPSLTREINGLGSIKSLGDK